MMQKVKCYDQLDLIRLLKNPESLMLIDVRDQDFGEGGFIKHALHIPSVEFGVVKAKGLIERSLSRKIDDLVCYCSYGKARSVQCATLLNTILLEDYQKSVFPPRIGYLKGGFVMFKAWNNDSEYVIHSEDKNMNIVIR